MLNKILIVHARAGMGHFTAAKALEEAFAENHPEIEVKIVDIIDFAIKAYKNVFVHGYKFLSEKFPSGWGLFFKYLDTKPNQTIADLISRIAIESNFFQFLKEYNPDFIIATYPLAMRLISLSKQKEIISIPSAMVITDFGFHSFWIDKETNYYFVATEELRQKVIARGISTDAVIASGIPIRLQFSKKIDRTKILKQLGFDAQRPIFSVIGGQCGYSSLEKIILGIKKQVHNVQCIIIAGRDAKLMHALDASKLHGNPLIKIFSFVKNIEEYMAISSLIFSKAGGLTVSECLAMGVPMIIYKIIPGQEEANVQYIIKNHLGIKAIDIDDCVSRAAQILANPLEIESMKKACLSLGKPHAALTIAEFVSNKI